MEKRKQALSLDKKNGHDDIVKKYNALSIITAVAIAMLLLITPYSFLSNKSV